MLLLEYHRFRDNIIIENVPHAVKNYLIRITYNVHKINGIDDATKTEIHVYPLLDIFKYKNLVSLNNKIDFQKNSNTNDELVEFNRKLLKFYDIEDIYNYRYEIIDAEVVSIFDIFNLSS